MVRNHKFVRTPIDIDIEESGHHGSQNDWHLPGKENTFFGAYDLGAPVVTQSPRKEKK